MESYEEQHARLSKDFVENGLLNTDLTISQIAKVLKVSEEFVLEVKKELEKRK